jgi:hypothetical protein
MLIYRRRPYMGPRWLKSLASQSQLRATFEESKPFETKFAADGGTYIVSHADTQALSQNRVCSRHYFGGRFAVCRASVPDFACRTFLLRQYWNVALFAVHFCDCEKRRGTGETERFYWLRSDIGGRVGDRRSRICGVKMNLANQSSDPAFASGTPRAGHETRHR